jgi:hypothetical protein
MSLPIVAILDGVSKLANDLITTDEERDKMRLADRVIDAQLLQGQIATNQVEAAHPSTFVAGWRPGVGWVGVAGLGYQFLLYPMLVWCWSLGQAIGYIPSHLPPPPLLDTDALIVLLSAVLGVAGLRTFDKAKHTDTKRIGEPREEQAP